MPTPTTQPAPGESGLDLDRAAVQVPLPGNTSNLVGRIPKRRPRDEADPELQPQRDVRPKSGLDWPTFLWISALHVGVLAAPFTFTWQGLGTMLFLYWLTGSIGICLGFHRLLTHRSFKTHRITRAVIGCIGGLAGEGPPIYWVANHRKHHARSDQPGDPHTPHEGGWWSHITWLMWHREPEDYAAYNRRWAPDLADDRTMVFLSRTFILWHLALGFAMFAIGWMAGGPALGWSLVVWGMFVRLVFVLHITWLVNSASHMWGYRTYETTDDSRNNWWVALLTFGEGWHNNHHAFPTMARAGHRWWEIDTTFAVIRLMAACGLAWDIVDGHHENEAGERKKRAA